MPRCSSSHPPQFWQNAAHNGVWDRPLARRDYYDVWLPLLSPSPALISALRGDPGERAWKQFERRFRAEMTRPEARRVLDLLVALSRQTNFSVGCYCELEQRCHRSILRALLRERGARLA